MNKDFERNSCFDENVEKKKIQMVVFLSSIGVTRTKSFPFFILNSFGVLDAKRDAEIAIQNMSEEDRKKAIKVFEAFFENWEEMTKDDK